MKDKQEGGNNVGNFIQMSSSRWPKEEVEALIRLRTNVDVDYEGNNGTKGPLWEEISLAMKKLGYDRSAEKCKEKWENINKYFKRMRQKTRESQKIQRHVNSIISLMKYIVRNLERYKNHVLLLGMSWRRRSY